MNAAGDRLEPSKNRKLRFGSLNDTSPSMEAVRLDILRRMTPSERLALALEASLWLRELSLAGIRMRHPHATPEEVDREYARIVLPRPLYQRLYPQEEGAPTMPRSA
jgi:hypothetical protein